MKARHAILLALFAALIQLHAEACSCEGPDKFMQSVGPYMMEIEVLDVIALDTIKGAYTATRVKVNRMMKGEYESDTLLFLIDKGFECFRALPQQEKGKRYIITGDLLSEWNSFGIRVDSSFHGKMMVLDLCSENVLYFDGGFVHGNITRNRKSRSGSNHKVRRMLMSESNYQDWLNARMNPDRPYRGFQRMSIVQLEQKLRSKKLI